MIVKDLCTSIWVVSNFMLFLKGEGMEDLPENSTLSGMGGYGVWHNAQDILDIFNQDEMQWLKQSFPIKTILDVTSLEFLNSVPIGDEEIDNLLLLVHVFALNMDVSEYHKLPSVRAVVSTYQDLLSQPSYDPHNDPPVHLRRPFIAIEGTHRDSRILLGKELANFLQATYLGNPPRSMLPLRRLFDKEKGMLRKAYFSLCMYVGAHHVRETWAREPVVTTGYWLDQAAFSLAQRFALVTLPPADHPVYQWPEDLVKPDVAFFLNIPSLKGSSKSPNPFKPKLVEVYRRLKGVKIIEINQTGSYRKIFSIIRTHLKIMFNIKDPDEDKTQAESHEQKYRERNEYDDAAYVNR